MAPGAIYLSIVRSYLIKRKSEGFIFVNAGHNPPAANQVNASVIKYLSQYKYTRREYNPQILSFELSCVTYPLAGDDARGAWKLPGRELNRCKYMFKLIRRASFLRRQANVN